MSTAYVETAHLFRPLGRELVDLLRGLDESAWGAATSAAAWTVKDVVAHLLDVDYRRLSTYRDHHEAPPPDRPVHTYAELVAYLNTLNAEWIRAAQRLSRRVLIDSIDRTIDPIADLMESADPWAPAIFPVAWAGQSASPMWLDIGREYTERWHHQDQIRDAVGAPPLGAAAWLLPVLEISLHALPHAYRDVRPDPLTRVRITVSGEVAREWHLAFASEWQLESGPGLKPACTVHVADINLARLLTHRLSARAIEKSVTVEGAAELAAPLLSARAVMV